MSFPTGQNTKPDQTSNALHCSFHLLSILSARGFQKQCFQISPPPLEMCSMSGLPKEEGGLDTCIAEGQTVHAPGFSGDRDTLPARWFCTGPAGAHQHLLAPSSSGPGPQDPSWLLLHYRTALRFWGGLLALELIQLRALPPWHHWHRFCAVPKIPPKIVDS